MPDSPRPNILLIISDDHGYGDMSRCGSPDAHTPHLDRIAAEGIAFTDAYVSAPICSPSRAGLIAGAHQQRWGARWFDTSSFPPAERPVLPEILAGAGYRTGYFGKVHYGADEPGSRSCPEQHGFEESLYGLASKGMGRLHYLRHSRRAVEEYGEAASRHGVHPLYENGAEVDCENHVTVEFTQRALDFIGTPGEGEASGEGEDRPFFCMVAYNAVHNFTWQLPEEELEARDLPPHADMNPEVDEYLDWYDGSIWPNLDHGRAYYLAQLEIMDREIGRLLDHLEQTGQRENTMVIYLTDNGGSTCNYGCNTPLTGTKYTLFEGGVRTPMMISWPGVVPQGARSDALVSSLDLLPTAAAAAGATLPTDLPIDGQDLRPVWEGHSAGHEALHFDTGFQWAVRTPQWKLRYAEDGRHRQALLDVEHTDIGEGLNLTDLSRGPEETAATDLADAHPEIVQALTALHDEWEQAVASGRPLARRKVVN